MKILLRNLLSSKFEVTLCPTVPARSVAPMTAIERGKNSGSNPARGIIFFPSRVDNGLAEGLDNRLTQCLPRKQMRSFFHNRSAQGTGSFAPHITHHRRVSAMCL